jgi:hypothetical protein
MTKFTPPFKPVFRHSEPGIPARTINNPAGGGGIMIVTA